MKLQGTNVIPRLAAIILILCVIPLGAAAQSKGQFDDATPPQHAAGLGSLGSYTGADLGTVNLANGALNLRLPLGEVGGRGLSLPLTLNYSSKVWSASRDTFSDPSGDHPVAYAAYADSENLVDLHSRVAPGWTVGAAPALVARGTGIKDNQISPCAGDFLYALTRLTVILPDKGEVQLRDAQTNGAPLAAQATPGDPIGCTFHDGNRGPRWHSTDGSGLVFISDPNADVTRGNLNGVLVTADGTRYRFTSTATGYGGSVETIKRVARAASVTDRNGNTIQIGYPSASEVRYTDPLGRVTRIQKNVPDPANPSVTLPLLVTFNGFGGQPRYFKARTAVMSQRYRPGVSPVLPVITGDHDPVGAGWGWGAATRLFPQSFGQHAQRVDTAAVLSELVLPDGRGLRFYYNEYGEVAEVRLPTGGKLQYDYAHVGALPAGKSLPGETTTSYFFSDVSQIERAVVARRVYPDGAGHNVAWNYAYTASTAEVTASTPSGAVLLKQKHYFLASGRYLNTPAGAGPVADRGVEGTGYALWSTGLEHRAETLDPASQAVLAKAERDWTQRAPLSWAAHTAYGQEQPEHDNRAGEARNFLDDGRMSKTVTSYDQYNNPTDIYEYDFGAAAGATGALLRRTHTDYVTGAAYVGASSDPSLGANLRSLPSAVWVSSDAAGSNKVSRAEYEYDNYSSDPRHAPLLARPGITGHDAAAYPTSFTRRGNLTGVTSYADAAAQAGPVTVSTQYDVAGNAVRTIDARLNASTATYADSFCNGSACGGTFTPNTFAFPTSEASPVPDPTAITAPPRRSSLRASTTSGRGSLPPRPTPTARPPASSTTTCSAGRRPSSARPAPAAPTSSTATPPATFTSARSPIWTPPAGRTHTSTSTAWAARSARYNSRTRTRPSRGSRRIPSTTRWGASGASRCRTARRPAPPSSRLTGGRKRLTTRWAG